jgi:hypothetical protein
MFGNTNSAEEHRARARRPSLTACRGCGGRIQNRRRDAEQCLKCADKTPVAKATEQFDEAGRMRLSPYYDRLVDVMEELMKFTYLTRGVSD